MDFSYNQAIEIAKIVFPDRNELEWKVDKQNKSGFWMSAVDKADIKYYCHMTEYFEIFSSTHIPADLTREKKSENYSHNIGTVYMSSDSGVPYINLLDWFYENGFNVFSKYPKK